MSALRTGSLYCSGNIHGTLFCQRLSRPQGHSAARKIISIKNCNDIFLIEPATFLFVAHCLNQLRYRSMIVGWVETQALKNITELYSP